MRRAKLEGRHIGRPALEIDQQAVRRDRRGGMSLREVAKTHGISRASVARVLQQPDDVEGAA
jgi:DNA invertase Pin-like site-specific DNA recombinase